MKLRTLLFVAFAIIVFSVAGLYIWVQSLVGTPGEQGVLSPAYNISILETGVLDYGKSGQHMMYLRYSLTPKDLDSVTVESRVYPSEIPDDIYVLNHACAGLSGCAEVTEFRTSLEAELKSYGLLQQNSILQFVNEDQLARKLTQKAIVIIPTGYLPADLVDTRSDMNLKNMLDMGCVVVYIGNTMNFVVYSNGTTAALQAGSLTNTLGINSIEGLGTGADAPYNLERSDFRLIGNITKIANGIYSQKVGNGYFVAFPDSLSLGWHDSGPAAAGQDVARFISEVAWQSATITGIRETQLNGSVLSDTIFLAPSYLRTGYVRTYVDTYYTNNSQNVSFKHEHIDRNISTALVDSLLHSESGVNGSTLYIDLVFNENIATSRTLELYLKAYQNGAMMQSQYLGNLTFKGNQRITEPYKVNLSGGDHLLRLADITGKEYAQSFLHIPEVTVEGYSIAWDAPSISLALTSDGNPVSNTRVTVKFDDDAAVSLVTDSNGIFTFVPSSKPGFGMHTANVTTTGRTFSLQLDHVRPSSFLDSTVNQVILFATLLVLIVGIALRRTEPPKYYIDIPDFPPQKRERILISRYSLMNLLESVNVDYKWKYMPLTVDELKANVRKKLKYQGKPVLISDYNLEKLLRELVAGGQVFESMGSYGLSGWTKQSGKSSQYLTLFRQMRNFFVNNAILFTEVGQSTSCDTIASYRGENLYVHIYSGDETVKRALLTARKGRTFIIFQNTRDVEKFFASHAISSDNLSVALKMEMDSNQIKLAAIDSLGVILGMTG